jgi:glutathione S-transferase
MPKPHLNLWFDKTFGAVANGSGPSAHLSPLTRWQVTAKMMKLAIKGPPMNHAQTDAPEFISLEAAAAMTTGTRVTFIPGMPALYAEALKNICYVKGVPLIRALHPMMGVDKETGEDRQAQLYELTRQTGLPTMFHNAERPRNVWIEQLTLAENIGAANAPKLIPDNFARRAEMLGLCAVILGEDGMVWNMRIMSDSPLAQKYGYSEHASAAAPGKVAEVINLIDTRLAAQEQQGSPYLVGNAISAVDVYWATMSMCVLVPPTDIMPVTQQNKGMLKYFGMNGQIPVIAEALSHRIEQHQRHILTTYCETPAVLGGDPL